MYYYKITTNQIIEMIETEKQLSVDEMHNLIQCDSPLQMVRAGLPDVDIILVLDDCGKLFHKPVNTYATMIYNNPYDFIVGDVLLGTVGYTLGGERDIFGFDTDITPLIRKILKI